ncbi:MAG TPA: nuclear transport factor 2 family protein [Pseudonocardiaceae bacterium]|jgi:ketosteroid isomerase-like protein|nr:nuclear transport factor 2 family protein [Pseudonocardiaceae bacterium]
MSASAQLTGPHAALAAYHEMVLRREPELLDVYTEDAVHELPFSDRKFSGREAIRAAYTGGWARSSMGVDEITDLVVHDGADPDMVIAEYRARVTMAGGEVTRVPIVLVLRARGERIASAREYVGPYPQG